MTTVKRCPTCKKIFTDQNLSFCTDDGTPLLPVDATDDEATVVRSKGDSATAGSSAPYSESPAAPPYQPPGSYTPSDYAGQRNRKTWPWAVGILAIVFLVVAGLGIAGVILIPRMMRAGNTNSRNANANVRRLDSNSNLNDQNNNKGSNQNGQNEGNNSAAEDSSPPTEENEVLQTLTDLEHEWTVANINADKKKLDRILADDYVGSGPDGKPQGKAEYLRTASRDTAIQNWDFKDLKLSLKGDRATLSGVIRLEVRDERGQNQTRAFNFTDKFVWRDGRWQATGSVVSPLKEG